MMAQGLTVIMEEWKSLEEEYQQLKVRNCLKSIDSISLFTQNSCMGQQLNILSICCCFKITQ